MTDEMIDKLKACPSLKEAGKLQNRGPDVEVVPLVSVRSELFGEIEAGKPLEADAAGNALSNAQKRWLAVHSQHVELREGGKVVEVPQETPEPNADSAIETVAAPESKPDEA